MIAGRRRPRRSLSVALLVALAACRSRPGVRRSTAVLEGDVQRAKTARPPAAVDVVLTDERGFARQAATADEQGGFVFVVPAPGVKRLAVFSEQGAQGRPGWCGSPRRARPGAGEPAAECGKCGMEPTVDRGASEAGRRRVAGSGAAPTGCPPAVPSWAS